MHYFHVPIDEEVQFKVFVVVSVRVDHLLRYLRMKQVFPVNELVMDLNTTYQFIWNLICNWRFGFCYFEEAHVKEELQNRPEREIKVGCGGSWARSGVADVIHVLTAEQAGDEEWISGQRDDLSKIIFAYHWTARDGCDKALRPQDGVKSLHLQPSGGFLAAERFTSSTWIQKIEDGAFQELPNGVKLNCWKAPK